MDAIREVSKAAGQHGSGTGADPSYVRLLIDHGTVLVAEQRGAGVVGWGATSRNPLGELLTDLFVHPARHGRGIGAAVLSELWPDPHHGRRFTFSSQHTNALPLYARAGLLPSWPLLYLTGAAGRLPETGLEVDLVDAATAALADAELVGGDRRTDYDFWTKDAAAVIVRSGAQLVAAGALSAGELLHLTSAAEDSVVAALRAASTDSVSLCIPGRHPVVAMLLRSGFRISEYDIAMSTADLELPPTWVYSPGLA